MSRGVCQFVYCPPPLDLGWCWCYGVFVVERSTIAVQFSTTMNTTILFNNPATEKYNELMDEVANNKTIQQILYTIATIAGVIVGVTVWIANRVSDWYNSGGRETLLKYTKRVLLFLSVSTEKLYYWVCDVTLSELSTNTPKRV